MWGFRCAFTDLATDLCFYSPGIQGSQAAVFLSTMPMALLPIRTAIHKETSVRIKGGSQSSSRGRIKLLTGIQVAVFNLELQLVLVWNVFPCREEDLALYKREIKSAPPAPRRIRALIKSLQNDTR